MTPVFVNGDLLDQDVEVIVNAWNRNIIPWWLLWPQGVSGAIRRRAGLRPFIEVGRVGPMKLGTAALTSAGRLPHRAIIHVAGIDMFWRASERSIRGSVAAAMEIVHRERFTSVAFPVLGAGTGGFEMSQAIEIMRSVLAQTESAAEVRIVRFAVKGAG
jgi:O-acetyl-ADP-ribose deacetylase (regulator of RNase III)